ncbi:hypothetical protein SS209_01045 [Salmonella enterica subsp. enterica serovar Senftenberg str. SS209]|nr:hypothetical protein SS209_01045 [Salmonella enterica subsp. enterica serovar Senftenberg str. SS209]
MIVGSNGSTLKKVGSTIKSISNAHK